MATTARGAKGRMRRGECEEDGYACQPKRGERLHEKGKQAHVRQTQLLRPSVVQQPHTPHIQREVEKRARMEKKVESSRVRDQLQDCQKL